MPPPDMVMGDAPHKEQLQVGQVAPPHLAAGQPHGRLGGLAAAANLYAAEEFEFAFCQRPPVRFDVFNTDTSQQVLFIEGPPPIAGMCCQETKQTYYIHDSRTVKNHVGEIDVHVGWDSCMTVYDYRVFVMNPQRQMVGRSRGSAGSSTLNALLEADGQSLGQMMVEGVCCQVQPRIQMSDGKLRGMMVTRRGPEHKNRYDLPTGRCQLTVNEKLVLVSSVLMVDAVLQQQQDDRRRRHSH